MSDMKHTDHPNWKNLSDSEKNAVRRTNYRKSYLENRIKTLENCISEDKKKGLVNSTFEGVLRRKQYALDNNPFYEEDEDVNFMEDLGNILKDHAENARKKKVVDE